MLLIHTFFSPPPCRRSTPWGWTVANFFLDKIKAKIGMEEQLVLHVGAAPIHRKVLEHFMRYNLPVLELYGMSEDTGPASLNTIKDWRLGSVGKKLLGTQIKIDNPDENREGEVSGPSFVQALDLAGQSRCERVAVTFSYVCVCVC